MSGILRIALRADASVAIGLGHVKRCLALAMALRALGIDVRLITRDLGVDARMLARKAGIECFVLSAGKAGFARNDDVPHAVWAGVASEADAAQCVEALGGWQPDWVCVDHYAFDARWHDYVARALKVRIAVIDDLADRELRAELLIDPNLSQDHREKYARRVPARTPILGGPRFALLGPAYADAPRLLVSDIVSSIGIFMGGVDAANLTGLALRACRGVAGFTGPVEIVITQAHPHIHSLEALANECGPTSLTYDLPDLAAFFGRHDLQIGAGGGAAWERCCIGAPTLALRAASNQDAVLPGLSRLGAVALTGDSSPPDVESVGREMLALIADPARRHGLSERSRTLVDGLGARRVALRLAAHKLAVRPATSSDAEMMYRWRNHPATRRVSLSQQEISWPDHQRWLGASLQAADRCLLVGRVGNLDVGVMRFDTRGEGLAEVSLYLDPAMHGLGIGRSLLLAGEAYLCSHRAGTTRFTATVLESNTSSVRLFSSCGYELREGSWQKGVTYGTRTRYTQ